MTALERALADPRLAGFWQRVHRRYGASSAPVRRAALQAHEERVALAELLRVVTPPSRSVDLGRLAGHLGTDAPGLRAAVEARLGDAGDRAAQRDAVARARREAADRLAGEAVRIDPALEVWARRQAVVVDGRLQPQVDDALAVLAIVAARRADPVPLPIVAAEHLGDPHALDDDRRLGRLLTNALAARWTDGTGPVGAATRRPLLRRIGIVADELSSTVTVLQLPVVAPQPLAAMLAGGTPVAVTLDQLLREPLTLGARARGRSVFVVENPAVVSAAALLGHRGSFVCTSGVPSVAALELLGRLHDQGVRLLAHADFDAAGLAIVDRLVAAGATPWRMSVSDYLAAPASAVALERSPGPVSWAPGLADAMIERGYAVYEEQLVGELLGEDAPEGMG